MYYCLHIICSNYTSIYRARNAIVSLFSITVLLFTLCYVFMEFYKCRDQREHNSSLLYTAKINTDTHTMERV